MKVGITGGIGSGKTFICKKFEALGVPVYSADTRAKWLMQHKEEVKQQLIQSFGASIYANGELNRKKLAETVFYQPQKLAILNGIVHPAVAEDYKHWQQQNAHHPYTIKEAALLIESGSYKELDKLVLVTAPSEIRILRTMQRDGVSKESVEARINNQMSDADKMELADYIINNDGNRELDRLIERLNALFTMQLV